MRGTTMTARALILNRSTNSARYSAAEPIRPTELVTSINNANEPIRPMQPNATCNPTAIGYKPENVSQSDKMIQTLSKCLVD